MPEKLDLAKVWKEDYAAPRRPLLLQIAEACYLSAQGQGEPGGKEFSMKVGALYAMAYTIKMTRKFDGRQDYTISRLEAQWWGNGGQKCFASLPKAEWCWRLMIRTPNFVENGELEAARKVLRKRGKHSGTEQVSLHTFTEGKCVQMLHVGPYEAEGETVQQMARFAADKDLVLDGLHHEIYISDPRRIPAERLKTILRCPVRPAK